MSNRLDLVLVQHRGVSAGRNREYGQESSERQDRFCCREGSDGLCQETTYGCPDPKDCVRCPEYVSLRHMDSPSNERPGASLASDAERGIRRFALERRRRATGTSLATSPRAVHGSHNEEQEMTPSSIVPQVNEQRAHSSMMAWRVHEFGPPDVMRFERVLRPESWPWRGPCQS